MKKFMRFFIFSLLLLSSAIETEAHESTDTGKVQILIHVDPDDIAVAGVPTTIHVNIKSNEKTFSIEKCHCSLYVEKDEKRLITVPLAAAKDSSIYDAMGVQVSFPEAGTYRVGVEGTPTTAGTFSPFTAEVTELVQPVGTEPSSAVPPSTSNHLPHTEPFPILESVLTGTCLLILLYFLYIQRTQKMRF